MDELSNRRYGALLLTDPTDLRARLLEESGARGPAITTAVEGFDGSELRAILDDLAGHEIGSLVKCYEEAAKGPGPAVVFAFTIKGWGLPIAHDPLNHSALLSEAQLAALAEAAGADILDPWKPFDVGTPEHDYIAAAARRLVRDEVPVGVTPPTRLRLEVRPPRQCSTQEALGRFLTSLERDRPDVASQLVTASPDVASSTNLGGWINKVGVWSRNVTGLGEQRTGPLRWVESSEGRHIELGISETNLVLLLGQLGLATELSGQRLIPVGTVYDPFVCRGLDALIHAVYQESRFVLVGTPSGVTLSPEGGAHQSVITPSIGLELPGIVAYEPCFAQELGWILEQAIDDIGAGRGPAWYVRLSTKAIDQALLRLPDPGPRREQLRRRVLGGCHRIRDASGDADDSVHLFATGAMVPEALDAAAKLEAEGVDANVFSVTSADRLFQTLRQSTLSHIRTATHVPDPTGLLRPGELGVPIVTVIDGHPHTLSFVGSAFRSPSAHLGVDHFGQSGSRRDLYADAGIDADSIANAAIGLVDAAARGTGCAVSSNRSV